MILYLILESRLGTYSRTILQTSFAHSTLRYDMTRNLRIQHQHGKLWTFVQDDEKCIFPIWHIYFAWNIYNYCIKTDAKSKYTYSYDYFHPLLCLLSHKSKVCELYIWIVCINLQCVNFWAFLILIELAKDFGTI